MEDRDFFREEERCGYLITEKMKRVWAVQLAMVDEVERDGIPFKLKKVWIFFIRFLTPILVGVVTVTGFYSIYTIVRG